MSAHAKGRVAGIAMLAPSLCPFPDGSADAADWELGWREATAEEIARKNVERRIARGCLAASACTELGT